MCETQLRLVAKDRRTAAEPDTQEQTDVAKETPQEIDAGKLTRG